MTWQNISIAFEDLQNYICHRGVNFSSLLPLVSLSLSLIIHPDSCSKISKLSAVDTFNKNITNLNSKFRIDNISIENHRFPNMYSMPKMHKNPIKAIFLKASPKFVIVFAKSSIKPFVKTIPSIFRLSLDKH